MQYIQITDELLKRYHSGECSVEQQAAVEAWLEDPEEDFSFLHDPKQEAVLELLLWDRLQKNTVSKEAPLKKFRVKPLWLSVAASLLLIAASAVVATRSGFFKVSPQLVRIDNLNGQFAKAQYVNGLILTALPKGDIKAKISNSSGNVTFCEVMFIENRSVEDVVLDFASTCTDGVKSQKNFICKKGISYVALKMSSISPEIIVVDQRYMEDYLPLNLAIKINNELRQI